MRVQRIILRLTLATWLALRAAAAASAQTTQSVQDAQLDFGIEGLPIPPVVVVHTHTPRTAQLLGDAYRRHDPLVWRRVQYVAELGRIQLAAGAPAVAEAMKDAAPEVRAEAARAAALIGEASLLPEVEKLLGDADASVRREAVLAAAKLARAQAKPTAAIEKGLADAQPHVIAAALETAWLPHHAELVAVKLAALPAELKADAAAALGRLKAAKESAAILPLLEGDVVQRAAALRALGDMGDAAQTQAVLAKLLDEHPTVRREAVTAMGKLADAPTREARAIRMLGDADTTVRQAAAEVLTPLPSAQALATLATQLAVDYAPLHEATRAALTHPADDAMRRAVIDFAAAMLTTNPDPRRREDASYILGRLHSDAALDAHVALLKWNSTDPKKTDWSLVAQAAESLGLVGNAKACEPLIDLVKAAPQALAPLPPGPQRDAMARAMADAMVSLDRLRYAPALKEAVRILQIDPASCPPKLHAAAAYAVGVLGSANGKSEPAFNLFGIYDSIYEDHAAKLEAIKALGNLRYAPAAERLKPIAQTETTPDIRWIAHWSYERCANATMPYAPPTEPHEPPVSVTDLAK